MLSTGDVVACLVGFLFPYGLFLTWRPPFSLRLDTTNAAPLEKLSCKWLKPILALSGTFSAGAAYTDRHSDSGTLFGLLLTTSFVIWLLTAPAGVHAFRANYG
jgi:hypothetical protein